MDPNKAFNSGGLRKDYSPASPLGYFWKGTDGQVYVQGSDGIKSAGKWDEQTSDYWAKQGFVQTSDSPSLLGANTNTNTNTSASSSDEAKVLDQAGLDSLDSLVSSLGITKDQSIAKAGLTRDEAKATKKTEMGREKGKYDSNKLSTLQDFSGALTDTNLSTRDTIENLISSLSTLGLGGSRALTRQLLNAGNMSNRKANATQAADNKNLDSAFNEYNAGYGDDINKIDDQYGYEAGEAKKKYYEGKQTALYKQGDIYGNFDDTATRSGLMKKGDDLNSMITGSTFLNPSYAGESAAMATPELGDYTQDIAKYDTSAIQGANAGVLTPVASDGMNAPGNLAVRAMAVNDKDLGIKKRSENDLGYGV
jgi:hypothetical protein